MEVLSANKEGRTESVNPQSRRGLYPQGGDS